MDTKQTKKEDSGQSVIVHCRQLIACGRVGERERPLSFGLPRTVSRSLTHTAAAVVVVVVVVAPPPLTCFLPSFLPSFLRASSLSDVVVDFRLSTFDCRLSTVAVVVGWLSLPATQLKTRLDFVLLMVVLLVWWRMRYRIGDGVG